MTITADESTDQYGIPRSAFEDVLTRLSPEAAKMVDERALHSTTNFLYLVGVPKTPAELAMFAQQVATGMLAAAVVDGWVELTEKGTASEADEAQAKTEMERAKARRASTRADVNSLLAQVSGGYL